jgi:hypothetical protein
MMVIDLTGDSSSEQAEKQALTREKRVSDNFVLSATSSKSGFVIAESTDHFLSR